MNRRPTAAPALSRDAGSECRAGRHLRFKVSDAAGGNWPDLARSSALALNNDRAGMEDSLDVTLLADVWSVFDATGGDKIGSADLVKHLVAIEEAPWGDLGSKELDARKLARRLKPYDINPHTVRIGTETPKGYERADFLDAWARYLPPSTPPQTATSATPQQTATDSGPLTSDVAPVADVAVPGRGAA